MTDLPDDWRDWPAWKKRQWRDQLRTELRRNRQAQQDSWLAWLLAFLDEADLIATKLAVAAARLGEPDTVTRSAELLAAVSATRDRLLGLDKLEDDT